MEICYVIIKSSDRSICSNAFLDWQKAANFLTKNYNSDEYEITGLEIIK